MAAAQTGNGPVLTDRSTRGSSGGVNFVGLDDGGGVASMAFCVGVVAAYGIVSVALTMANKVVMSVYGFSFELSLLLVQLVVGTTAMFIMKSLRLISVPPITMQLLRKCTPLTLWFFVYVISGLASLRSLSVPTWAATRRITALCILCLDYWEGKSTPYTIWGAVLIMICGAFLAAHSDLEGTLMGYLQVGVNCLSSAQYLREVTAVKRSTGLSEVGVLLCTNIVCIPIALGCIISWGEHTRLSSFENASLHGFQFWLVTSALLAGLLNYLVFLSASVNSPLTTSIAGQVKNVVSSLGGFLLLPSKNDYDPTYILGIAIGLWASMWYAWLKYKGFGGAGLGQGGSAGRKI